MWCFGREAGRRLEHIAQSSGPDVKLWKTLYRHYQRSTQILDGEAVAEVPVLLPDAERSRMRDVAE